MPQPVSNVHRLALTPGEPAGIGPDLVVRLAQTSQACELVAIADPALLQTRARLLGLPLELLPADYDTEPAPPSPGTLRIDPIRCASSVQPGQVDPANAPYVLDTLAHAVDRCRAGTCAGLVTGPVHKAVINQAGVAFTGHTGFLAERCGGMPPVMMLSTDDAALRVALVTVHMPLAEVATAVTQAAVTQTLRIVQHDLQTRFGIARPRLLVAGLNPHAGEDGYLGHEDDAVIAPAITAEQTAGAAIRGPLPADTLFTPDMLQQADAIVAMYHDQGLPVIKHMGFGRTVNITLGLPIIRTSVDHGTALDRVGDASINTGSLQAAINTALEMAQHSHGA